MLHHRLRAASGALNGGNPEPPVGGIIFDFSSDVLTYEGATASVGYSRTNLALSNNGNIAYMSGYAYADMSKIVRNDVADSFDFLSGYTANGLVDLYSTTGNTNAVVGTIVSASGLDIYARQTSKLVQISLGSAHDLSSIINIEVLDLSATSPNTSGAMHITSDLANVYWCQYNGKRIDWYTFNTPGDISAGFVYESAFNTPVECTDCIVTDDGTKLAYMSYADDSIHQIHMSAPFDPSTGVEDAVVSVGGWDNNPRLLSIAPDSSRIYISGIQTQAIHQLSRG